MSKPEGMKNLLWVCVGVICLTMVTPAAAKPPSILSVRPSARQVGLYEKLELRIDQVEHMGILQSFGLDVAVDGAFFARREGHLAIRGYRYGFARQSQQPSWQFHRCRLVASWIHQDRAQSAVSEA
jgi:hypothetical protein